MHVIVDDAFLLEAFIILIPLDYRGYIVFREGCFTHVQARYLPYLVILIETFLEHERRGG